MPQALRVDRAESARGEAELQRLLVECRAFSGEFPDFLANHLPMVLVAMHRLGGSDERLNAFFATYRDANRLPPPPARVAPIARESWDAALGDRARESDYRDFFHAEVARIGARAAVASYLPRLLPGLAASATHGLMRLAYGVLREDSAEIAIALGYWAATYLELGVAAGSGARDRRSGGSSAADAAGRILPRRRDGARPALAFHARNGRQAGVSTHRRQPRHRPRHGRPDARGLARALCRNHGFLRAARRHRLPLAQDVAPGDACPRNGAALFLAVDRRALSQDRLPRIADSEAVEGWRRLPCPAWPEIEAAAVRSDDEHDLSLVFSAREEFGTFGDRLYQVVAARRMQLIP